MLEAFYISLFAILFAMAPVWWVLISWVFRRLREKHTLTYEAIGSPTLFWNNSPRNNWLFLKFIFGARWQELDDTALIKVSRIVRVFSVVYMLGFLGFVVLFFVMAR